MSAPGVGHNSGGIASDRLNAFIQRIERLNEDKAAVCEDIKNVYAEAKGNGFDVKTLRAVVRRRAMDKAERDEQDALLDVYEHALGMLE